MEKIVTGEDLRLRLQMLGYTPSDKDIAALDYCVKQAVQTAKNECCFEEIPQEMAYAVIDLAAALFLSACAAQVAAAWAQESGEQYGGPKIKTIQEGDTSITYMTNGEGDSTVESRLSALTATLKADVFSGFEPFRRIAW